MYSSRISWKEFLLLDTRTADIVVDKGYKDRRDRTRMCVKKERQPECEILFYMIFSIVVQVNFLIYNVEVTGLNLLLLLLR